MILRPSLLRAIGEHTRAAHSDAHGAPLDLVATTHRVLRDSGRDPETCDVDFRAAVSDAVEACIYALGGGVQSGSAPAPPHTSAAARPLRAASPPPSPSRPAAG